VALNNLSTPLKDLAIASVASISLDFGAVDCAMGNDNNPYIIEINSGPGLQGTSFEKYTEAFGAKLVEMERPTRETRSPSRRGRGGAQGTRRAAAGRSVGADTAEDNTGGLVRVMHNVRTDEQAQALLDALVRGDI
jgi:hypothetical protein